MSYDDPFKPIRHLQRLYEISETPIARMNRIFRDQEALSSSAAAGLDLGDDVDKITQTVKEATGSSRAIVDHAEEALGTSVAARLALGNDAERITEAVQGATRSSRAIADHSQDVLGTSSAAKLAQIGQIDQTSLKSMDAWREKIQVPSIAEELLRFKSAFSGLDKAEFQSQRFIDSVQDLAGRLELPHLEIGVRGLLADFVTARESVLGSVVDDSLGLIEKALAAQAPSDYLEVLDHLDSVVEEESLEAPSEDSDAKALQLKMVVLELLIFLLSLYSTCSSTEELSQQHSEIKADQTTAHAAIQQSVESLAEKIATLEEQLDRRHRLQIGRMALITKACDLLESSEGETPLMSLDSGAQVELLESSDGCCRVLFMGKPEDDPVVGWIRRDCLEISTDEDPTPDAGAEEAAKGQ